VELPHLEQMAREYRDRGVDFIAISNFRKAAAMSDDSTKQRAAIEEERAKLIAMATFNKMTMPVGFAPPGTRAHDDYYILNARTLLIDPDGKVLYQAPINFDRLREQLDAALQLPALARR
jgi:hypothetical protein